MTSDNLIHVVDPKQVDLTKFQKHHVGCLVLSHDNKIILQQRGQNWQHFPGCLATFGGAIEKDETPIAAIIRELNEELGAIVGEQDLIHLGIITEAITHHTDIIFTYFWHDKGGTITGCYEGAALYFDNYDDIYKHPKVMDDVRWLLRMAKNLELII